MSLGPFALLAALIVVLVAAVLWAKSRGPKKYAVMDLHEELRPVLARILLAGGGSVVIEAVDSSNLVQICVPIGGGLIVDVPAPQFGSYPTPEVHAALYKVSLSLRDWGHGLTWESCRHEDVGAAMSQLFDVLYTVFKFKSTDLVTLDIDYSMPRLLNE